MKSVYFRVALDTQSDYHWDFMKTLLSLSLSLYNGSWCYTASMYIRVSGPMELLPWYLTLWYWFALSWWVLWWYYSGWDIVQIHIHSTPMDHTKAQE